MSELTSLLNVSVLENIDTLIGKAIHRDDVMFGEKTTEDMYFKVGQGAAMLILQASLARFGVVGGTPGVARILDFGCGYGRVTRYIAALYPDSKIVASDVLKDGVDFCCETFGCTAHYSAATIEAIQFDEQFDLIFVGSVFTHIDERRAVLLLDLLASSLTNDGILIFTTHGRKMVNNVVHGKQHNAMKDKTLVCLKDYMNRGYGYADYKKKYYDDPVGYGTSLTDPSWIFNRISEREQITLLSFQERAWNDHQDVTMIIRRPL